MTQTLLDLEGQVSRRLNSDGWWGSAEIREVINDVYLEMCEYAEAYETSASLATTTSDTYYDLEAESTIFLTPFRVWNPSSGKWLEITYIRQLDASNFRWGADGAEPWEWFMRGCSMFGIHPRPTAAGTLTIEGSAIPPDLVADGDTPIFPDQFHTGLVDGVVAILKGLERETKIAQKFLSRYVAVREDLRVWVQSRISTPHVPVTGLRAGEGR